MSGMYLKSLLAIPLIAAAMVACGNEAPPTSDSPVPTISVEPEVTTVTVAPPTTETPSPSVEAPQPAPPPPANPPATTPAPPVNTCQAIVGGWSTLDDSTEPYLVSEGEMYDVRPGMHDCFDRVVLDVDTTKPVGFHVGYVSVVRQQGSGHAIAVDGAAALAVHIDTWAKGIANLGLDFKADWPALREIKFAGTHEGQTTLAIGVAHKTPFAVGHLISDDGQSMRVVIDIAH